MELVPQDTWFTAILFTGDAENPTLHLEGWKTLSACLKQPRKQSDTNETADLLVNWLDKSSLDLW